MWYITYLTILISVERCAHEVHRFVRQHLVVHWCQVRAGRKIWQYWNMHEYDVILINKNCDMPRNSWLHLGLYVWPGKPEIFEASNPMVSCLKVKSLDVVWPNIVRVIIVIIIIINDHNDNWDTMILMTPTDWCLMTLWMPRIATLSLAVKLNSLQMMADDSVPQKQIQICLNADH